MTEPVEHVFDPRGPQPNTTETTPPLPADRFAVTISLSIPPEHRETEATVEEAVEGFLRERDWQSESLTVSKRRGRW